MRYFFYILCFYSVLEGVALSLSGVKEQLDLEPPKTGNTFIYSPIGKRDPFKAPQAKAIARDLAAVNPLERFTLEQFHLKAILKGLGKNKAMFEDPEGKTHILVEGTVIGRERASVSRILNTEVILTLRTFNYLGQESISERIISLPSEENELDELTVQVPKKKGSP